MKMKNLSIRQKLSIAIILCGCVLIMISLGLNLYSVRKNKREVIAFQKTYIDTSQSNTEQVKEIKDETDEKIDDSDVIAILRIPTINCEEIVRKGSDKRALHGALGHVAKTANPGELGNCAIAGHRNYNFGLYFNRLNEVRLDDEIMIDTKDATYTYKVMSIKVVEPEEVSVLESTDEATITLITCTPLYIATHRLIVSGSLINVEYR